MDAYHHDDGDASKEIEISISLFSHYHIIYHLYQNQALRPSDMRASNLSR